MDEEPKKRPTAISKIDATSEAAYELIDQRARDRAAKTDRLRAMRLAKEEAEAKDRAQAKS